MKKCFFMSVGCAALLSLSTAAWATPGTYFSLNGGLVNLDDSDAKGPGGSVGVEYDSGIAIAAAVGYGFTCNVRMEVEVGYQKNDFSNYSGDVSSISGLLNAYYDFVNPTKVTPFIGAGVGLVKASLSDLPHVGGGDGGAVALQAGAGLSYEFNDSITFDLKYRYLTAMDLKVDDVELDYTGHGVLFGIRVPF